jgi:hypothetical protein
LRAGGLNNFKHAVKEAEVAETANPSLGDELIGDEAYQKVSLTVEAPRFEKKDQKRFKDLAIKRALGTATAEDNSEFAQLQRARRSFDESGDADAVIAEYRRRQMIIDVVEVLNRHVSFFKTEDQERIRTLGQTH